MHALKRKLTSFREKRQRYIDALTQYCKESELDFRGYLAHEIDDDALKGAVREVKLIQENIFSCIKLITSAVMGRFRYKASYPATPVLIVIPLISRWNFSFLDNSTFLREVAVILGNSEDQVRNWFRQLRINKLIYPLVLFKKDSCYFGAPSGELSAPVPYNRKPRNIVGNRICGSWKALDDCREWLLTTYIPFLRPDLVPKTGRARTHELIFYDLTEAGKEENRIIFEDYNHALAAERFKGDLGRELLKVVGYLET